MSSVPIRSENDGSPSATGNGNFRQYLGWTLFYGVCAVILAVCFLAWVAMLAPYRLPPEAIRAIEQAAAQARKVVWVNTVSHIYHRPGTRWYGQTNEGKYLSEKEALAEGDRAALNGQ